MHPEPPLTLQSSPGSPGQAPGLGSWGLRALLTLQLRLQMMLWGHSKRIHTEKVKTEGRKP